MKKSVALAKAAEIQLSVFAFRSTVSSHTASRLRQRRGVNKASQGLVLKEVLCPRQILIELSSQNLISPQNEFSYLLREALWCLLISFVIIIGQVRTVILRVVRIDCCFRFVAIVMIIVLANIDAFGYRFVCHGCPFSP